MKPCIPLFACIALGCMPDTGGGAGDGGLPAVGDPCPWTVDEIAELLVEARCPDHYVEQVQYVDLHPIQVDCLPAVDRVMYHGEEIALHPFIAGYAEYDVGLVQLDWGFVTCLDGMVSDSSRLVLVPGEELRTLAKCDSGGHICDPCATPGACEPFRGF